MFVQFRKKTFEISSPVPRPGEIVIHVLKMLPFPGLQNNQDGRFEYANKVWKIIFFALHEGLRLTFQKYKSKILQKEIVAEKSVVLAYGRVVGQETRVFAMGPQDCPYSECQVFPGSCVMEVRQEEGVLLYYYALKLFFEENVSALEALYHYSSYSGIDLNFNLKEVLEAYCPKVTPDFSQGCTLSKSVTFQERSSEEKKSLQNTRNGRSPDFFLAGAGDYACAYILPCMRNLHLHTVVDLNPALACVVAEKYGFVCKDTSCERALKRLNDCDAPLLVVATYHSTHVDIVEQALGFNPNTKIFLEKPPVTTFDQLKRLLELRSNGAFIEIGYNRRYIPMIRKAQCLVSQYAGPITMTCIIKELQLSSTHWYYWPTQGTRVTGNLCHWIDLGTFIIRRRPTEVHVVSTPGTLPGDELSVIVTYEDGSRLTLIATDLGNPLRGVQEYIDIRRHDLTIFIDDFLRMKVQKGGRERVYRSLIRDKGHLRMYKEFLETVAQEKEPQYPNDDLLIGSRLYLSVAQACLSKTDTIQL